MKISKLFVIVFSIVILLIISFFLIWYFQKNLITKFFTSQPKTHSVVRFDPKTAQKIFQNDILTGKGVLNGSVKLVISPDGETAEEKVNEKGIWLHTLPQSLKEGLYNLSVITQDRLGKIIGIKRYSINIASSPKKSILGLYSNINFNIIPKAYAQVVYNENICTSNLAQSIEYKCNNGQRCWDKYSQNATSCLWNADTSDEGNNSYCQTDSTCSNPPTTTCPYEVKQLSYSCKQGKRCFYQYFRNQSTSCEWKKGDIDHINELTRCMADLNCGVQTETGTSGSGRVGTLEKNIKN